MHGSRLRFDSPHRIRSLPPSNRLLYGLWPALIPSVDYDATTSTLSFRPTHSVQLTSLRSCLAIGPPVANSTRLHARQAISKPYNR